MIPARSSGILAHITSLPSRYGIGDIGHSSYEFLDFLVAGEQTFWQFLPTNPTCSHFDYSPYMSNSAFAGNPLLISPDLLLEEGYLKQFNLDYVPEFSPYTTEFTRVVECKNALLGKAYHSYQAEVPSDVELFLEDNPWLEDYCLFMIAKELFGDLGWFDWPTEIARRDQNALEELKFKHQNRFDYYVFEQYVFSRQWSKLHEKCKDKRIFLFGDLPIYVGYDSVDVWANQHIFELDSTTLKPTHVSGVPPDYFSETGQRWGNPLYRWQSKSDEIKKDLFQWWAGRLEHLFTQVDFARIDHFRGFESYWSIPEDCDTAIDGKWLKGPGIDFFNKLHSLFGPMNIIAEDLGIITKEVVALRDALEFPGMKVLQFAFDGDPLNTFLPHNLTTTECIIYTGTHDNDTTMGWFLSEKITDEQRLRVKKAANRDLHDSSPIHHDLMYLAQASISKLCIFPLQDVLGFGNDCKMNSPGEATGNWRWRCAKEFLTPEIEDYLARTTTRFGRNRLE